MTSAENLRTGRHCFFRMHVHLVFVTRYRRGVLTGEHHHFLREVFTKVCTDFGAWLNECDGEDDHVHLLVEYPPQIAISRLVNSLKGVSSRRLRQKYRVRTHGDQLWSPSYFAASCGGASPSIIREYVENQRQTPTRPGETRTD